MSDSDEFWDDLLGHIRDRVLVPVTGPELNVVTLDGTGCTLSEVIAERLNDKYHLELPSARMRMGEASAAVVRKHGRDEAERLYRVINDIIAEFDEEISSPLLDLASIEEVRLFVSMTPDRLLANAVNEMRFGGHPLVREVTFSPNRHTPEQERNMRAPTESEVCVVRLFGQAASTPQYAIHDEDTLEWIHSLLSGGVRLPDWFTYPLKNQPLLFIGCEVPDWLGRFLLRLSSETRLSEGPKQFFLVNSPDAKEPLLSNFCTTYCGRTKVQQLEMPPADFVAELRTRWMVRRPRPRPSARGSRTQPADGPWRPSPPAVGEARIFISYMHEDVAHALRLCKEIDSLGGQPWVDERDLHPGDEWPRETLRSIGDAHLFLPLISATTEREHEGYAFREWAEADERARSMLSRRFVVPVIVDDSPRPVHEYRHMPPRFRTLTFGLAPGGVPDTALQDLLTKEIRAQREGGAE